MSKDQPEIDLAVKYIGQFVNKKLEGLASTLEGFISEKTEADTPAPEPASVPVEAKVRIERAITKHIVTGGNMTYPIICKCKMSFNELAYVAHLRDEIIASLTAPDPAGEWWTSVTDSVR